ncbi:MAG: hypothetical protein ACJAUP_002329 [Cellvibrionaceae bacterium]|jgi:hypothetical protein
MQPKEFHLDVEVKAARQLSGRSAGARTIATMLSTVSHLNTTTNQLIKNVLILKII